MDNYTLTKEDFDREEFERIRTELLKEQDTINQMQSYKNSGNISIPFISENPGVLLGLFFVLMAIGTFSHNEMIQKFFAMSALFVFTCLIILVIFSVIGDVSTSVGNRKSIKDLTAYYEENVIKPLITTAFPRCEYLPRYDLKLDSKYQLVINEIEYKIYPTEDHISGEYRGVHFEQTDVFMEKYEVLEDERSTVHGSVFYTKLPKTVQGDIVLISKRFPKNEPLTRMEATKRTPINGHESVTKIAKSVEQYYGLPRIHMENMWFEDHFFTYAENPEEAFYVLTPPFMEQLEKLYNKYQLRIRIHGDELFLMKERATFEFDPNESLDIEYETINMRDDMLDLYNIMDCMLG